MVVVKYPLLKVFSPRFNIWDFRFITDLEIIMKI